MQWLCKIKHINSHGNRICLCFHFLKTFGARFLWELGNASVKPLIDCSPLQMLQFQLVVVHLALVITLLRWHSSSVLLTQAAPEVGECFWWLSHNPALPPVVLGHRVQKTPRSPNCVGRWTVGIDSVRAKQEQDNFPSEKGDASRMALGGQTEWSVSLKFMQPLLQHHGIFCVLKHCPVILDRELPEGGKEVMSGAVAGGSKLQQHKGKV